MHFVEILGSKLKQQNSKNFNEIALIFRHTFNAIYGEKWQPLLKVL